MLGVTPLSLGMFFIFLQIPPICWKNYRYLSFEESCQVSGDVCTFFAEDQVSVFYSNNYKTSRDRLPFKRPLDDLDYYALPR